MIDKRLRPHQSSAVQWLLSPPTKRGFFWHPTSAGKTFSAIAASQALQAKKILVVCGAMARPTWIREFEKWYPDLIPHPIRFGRERKGLTKKQVIERQNAYEGSIQIVSYDLVHEVHPLGWDFVIIDEVHNLRNPKSQQSRMLRTLIGVNTCPVIALTATMIPTEVQNIWNPVDTLFPQWYGNPSKTKGISWKFLESFCVRSENEYGVSYAGTKTEALGQLRDALRSYVHRVTEADYAHYLPPVNAAVLWIDEKRKLESIAQEWIEERCEEISHLCIVSYTHESHNTLLHNVGGKQYIPTFSITGLDSPEKRQRIIDEYSASNKGILFATSESIRESIDLSMVDAALIFEWRVSPASALQLSGRFARSNRTKPGKVSIQYVAFPSDESRAEKLQSRLNTVNSIGKADVKSEILTEVFKPRELTEERLDSMFEAMFSEVHLTLGEVDDDTDE